MGGINVNRWLIGGLGAAVVMFVLEGIGGEVYGASMEATLAEHNLSMGATGSLMAMAVLVSLIAGLFLVWVYAMARARLGAGPRTAVTAAVAAWLGAYVVSLLGYSMIGLFPNGMLATWGAYGLVEFIVAALVGARLYQE
jgi:hypothetical protein